MEEMFCERLAKLRIEKGVSAREMSFAIGQSAGYINSIENKKNLPSMSTFFYICEYLGISPKQFFDFESEFPQKIDVLYEYLKLLNEDQINNLTGIVKDLTKVSNLT